MFFDRFKRLCEERGVSVYRACTDIELNRSAVAKWKNGGKPNGTTAAKLAEYFGVSTDYLLTGLQKCTVTEYANGICTYTGSTLQDIEERIAERDPGTYQVVYRAPGIVITIDNDSKATEEQINSVIAIYNSDYSPNEKKPTVSGERTVDLSEVDFAFYGGYKELDEDDQETIRDMVRIMRERRKNKC